MEAQAVPFALAPAFANPDTLIFSEPALAKLLKSTIEEPLSIKFDCSPEILLLFLDHPVTNPLSMTGLASLVSGGDVPATNDLTESYGEIPSCYSL